MCYSNPAKSLEIARSRLSPEQWAKFELEFNDFCVVQGLFDALTFDSTGANTLLWARWAFFQGIAHGRKSPRRASRQFMDAHYEGLAIAMMSDEQALASLERWKEGR